MEQDDRRAWVLIGLGNPGRRYQSTRHNIGFMVVQAFAKAKGWTLKEDSRWPGLGGKGRINAADVLLLMPTTYMNESGQAVRRFLDYYKMPVASLLVVHDDIDLDYGTLKVRPGGGTGGHNGLKSIQAHLGVAGFKRLRMGIGDREHGDLADHVLADFTKDEQEQLGGFIQKSVTVIEELLCSDIHMVMNRVNAKKKAPEQKLKEQCDESAQENQHESREHRTEPL